MSKFQLWWVLKGEEKTNKIIGRTCRLFFYTVIGFVGVGILVSFIVKYGWVAVYAIGAVVVFVLIMFAAIFWGDK